MVIGLLLFVGGTLLTVLTLWTAYKSEVGGYVIVTWGLILVGAGDFLYGLFGLLSELFSKKAADRGLDLR